LLFLEHVNIHILNKTKYDKAHFFVLFGGLQHSESEQRDLDCLCLCRVRYRVLCLLRLFLELAPYSQTAAGLQASLTVNIYFTESAQSVKRLRRGLGYEKYDRDNFFSLYSVLDWPWGQHSLRSNGYRGPFPRDKAAWT
jgi:hypothetical protein